MNDRRPDLRDVQDFWDRRPCNIRHSPLEPGTRAYFEQVAERRYFVEPHVRDFADFAAWSGRRVLEIGCGIGTDGVQFARAGANYTGVDVSEVSLDLARRAFAAFGLPATLIRANAETIDEVLPAGAFDLVYAFGVIHHTPSPRDVVAAVRRVIRQHGVFKLMVYARESWKSFMIEAGLDQPEAQAACPIALTYARAEIPALLAGFHVEALEQDHIFPFVLDKYLRYEYEVLPWIRAMPPEMFAVMRKRLGWHLLVTARPG